jgi:hypothetical protein
MKIITTVVSAVLFSFSLSGQNLVGNVNAGAQSGTNLLYSVGEIYVLPASTSDETNSGTMGLLSKLEVLTSGITEIGEAHEVKVFPNPVSNSLFLESTNSKPVTSLYIYNVSGTLIGIGTVNSNTVDLTGLQAGSYIISTNAEKSQSFKIIKK